MKKLKHIYSTLNMISPMRFAVRVYCQDLIDVDSIKNNIAKRLHPDEFSTTDYSVITTIDIDRSILEAILTADKKIIVFLNKHKMGVVFDHSIADGRTGISFCLDIISKNCPIATDNDILDLKQLFPSKYKGITSVFHTSKDMALQVLSPFIQGITKHSRKFIRNGQFSEPIVVSTKFTSDVSKKLIAKSKNMGVSISSLLITAQILASQRILFDNSKMTIGVASTVDFRQRLTKNPNYNFLSLCVSVLTVVIRVSPNETLIKLLKKVHAKMISKTEKGAHIGLYKMIPPRRFISKIVLLFYLKLNEKASLFTNVGVIEKFCNRWELNTVIDVDFFVPPSSFQPYSVCVSSFKGVLSLNLMSFDDRLDISILKEVQIEIRQTLLEFLD